MIPEDRPTGERNKKGRSGGVAPHGLAVLLVSTRLITPRRRLIRSVYLDSTHLQSCRQCNSIALAAYGSLGGVALVFFNRNDDEFVIFWHLDLARSDEPLAAVPADAPPILTASRVVGRLNLRSSTTTARTRPRVGAVRLRG